ncbi:hypothetical protein ACFL15_01195 [Patescibacteria group bacterium]
MKDNNIVPQESETIAARRSVRIAEKIKNARSKFSVSKAWWSDGPLEIIGILVILIFNFYLVYPVFGTPAVETTFSGPFIPFMAKLISYSGIPEAYGVQIVNLIFHIFFPLTYYLFIRKISERKIIAFLATLLISVPVALFSKSRIEYSLLGTESPHICSLTMIPLALLGLLSFLREGGLKNLTTTSVFGAIIALISPFGFFIYLIFSVITTFSEILLGGARQKIVRFAFAILMTASLCSFWYDPVFFFRMAFGPMGEEVRTTANKLIPASFFLVPILATFGYLLFDRKPDLQPIFLAGFFSITFTVIFVAGKGIFPSHPGRYIPELGIGYSFLLAYIFYVLMQKIVNSKMFSVFTSKGIPLTLLAMFFITSLIVVSFFIRDNIYSGSSKVLGFSTSLPKGKIWLAKEKFSGPSSILGYILSAISLSVLVYLNVLALKKESKSASYVKDTNFS